MEAFLLAFAPPRWLRRLVQQAIAYRFLARLTAISAGTGRRRLWQIVVTLRHGGPAHNQLTDISRLQPAHHGERTDGLV